MKTFEKVRGTKHVVLLAIVALLLVVMVGLVACSEEESTEETSSSGSVPEAYADLKPVTLIFADGTAKNSAGNLWAQEIVANASEITGGKLTLDYHGNSEIGGDTDLMRQEQGNDIQMMVAQPAALVSFISGLASFDLPMAFINYDGDQIETVLNGDNDFTRGLQEDYEAVKVHNLGWLQNGTYRETTSNKDLRTLADFKGFMIRTMENSNHMKFWSAIGAEPTPMAFSEVYFALQNGTVAGQENALDSCVGSSFQEVQKYLCMTNHILYANNVSINKEAWDNLDPAYQDALTEAIAKATETLRPQLPKMNDENKQIMVDGGMEVIEYDDDFFEDVLSTDGVVNLYKSISEQTDGLSDKLLAELEKTADAQ